MVSHETRCPLAKLQTTVPYCPTLSCKRFNSLLLSLTLVPAWAQDQPSVTPYRPSVSTPANLSAPGWLEVEMGGLRGWADDPKRQQHWPYTLKLAFNADWGIRLSGDAWQSQTAADGSQAHGGGDTTVVLKRRLAVDETSAFGWELSAKIPTAARPLGSGHADYGLNAIYSADLNHRAWHTDLNIAGTHLGGVAPAQGATQVLWAASLSRNINERWGAVGELSGTSQRGVDRTAQWLMAATYNSSPALTYDVGVSKGLNSASVNWSVFAGITFLTAKLF